MDRMVLWVRLVDTVRDVVCGAVEDDVMRLLGFVRSGEEEVISGTGEEDADSENLAGGG